MKNRLRRNIARAGNTLVFSLLAVSLSGCFSDAPDEPLNVVTPTPLELPDVVKPAINTILYEEEPMIELGLNNQSSNFSTEWPEDFKNSLPFHIEGEPIDAPGSEWYSGRELEPDNPLEEDEEEEWAEDEDTANIAPDDFNYETEVSDPIPSFVLNEGFGGFMGFQVRVVQDSGTRNLSVTGTKWLPTFTGSFLLVLDSDDGECAVIEIPAMLINQYEYYFESEIIPHEQFPDFTSFRFLTNYHVQYEEFEPLISGTTERWFSYNVRHDQWYEITGGLVLPAGWLTLSNFLYLPEQNSWVVRASWDTEGIEQRIIDILFMDEDGIVLLELDINPQFHAFEPGEMRWLNASNDEELSRVRYVAVVLK